MTTGSTSADTYYATCRKSEKYDYWFLGWAKQEEIDDGKSKLKKISCFKKLWAISANSFV